MAEELKYTSGYDGATTDDLLGYVQEAKELDSNANVREAKEVGVNAYVKEAKEIGANDYVRESKQLQSNEYVKKMKEQTTAEDAETVQVFDVDGVPHKISKQELISKAGVQLPSLEEIGGFVAYDTNGQALGLMSKEQVAQVVGGLNGYAKHGFAYGDLNNLTQGGGYSLNSDVSPVTNGPSIRWGGLIVYNNTEFILQLAYNGINNTIQARTRNYNGVWNDWLTFKYA